MILHNTILHLGSNIPNKVGHIDEALSLIQQSIGNISKLSSNYMTAAWGNENQADFINKAIFVKTHLSPLDLLKVIKSIEIKMGRVKLKHWGKRIIDIDIIYYDDIIYKSLDLTIPHPFLHERNFVLQPLIEICPKYLHPIYHKVPKELLDLCSDDKSVISMRK